MAESFLNLARDINLQIQEAEHIPQKNKHRSTSPHIIIKFQNYFQGYVLKAARENNPLPTGAK